MKSPLLFFTALLIAASISLNAIHSQSLAPAQSIFMQGNNINSVFRTDGYYNTDKITFSSGVAGFVWPAGVSQRLTAVYATGLWIGAKTGPQRELRVAASMYNTHYSAGNIPVIGQVPSSSVCNDPSWRGYYVNLNDPSLYSGGTRYKTAGGRQYTFNYDSWANWPVQKGAPYVEVNGIPGYQPAWNGDRPGIGNGMNARPEELMFMVFMDYTNCTDSIHRSELFQPGGTAPLGAEIHQLVFNFNCAPLRDMYFIKYKIINKSSLLWDSTYFSVIQDPDIGDPNDDAVGCDSARNLMFAYNFDNNDFDYGVNPPAYGVRILQSPLKNTGSSIDTAKLPYDTLIGYKMTQMTGHNTFLSGGNPCIGDPDNAIFAFNYMRGKDGCGNDMINWVTGSTTTFKYSGNACNKTGWYDSLSYDIRDVCNMGPVTMNSGDTQIFVLGHIITRDGGNNNANVCALQSLSDSALKYYYNDFRTCIPIGIEPVSSEVPRQYSLYQNYPNPFNPVTKIKFSIPLLRGVAGEAGRGVLLKIYDILGREVTTLVNQELKPGTYEIDWDASNYPSGVYFYTLNTKNFTQTNKMVIIK